MTIKKFYIQNGAHQRVMNAANNELAAKIFLGHLILHHREEDIELSLSPFTITSQAGFLNDTLEWGTEKQFDNQQIDSTPLLLRELGEIEMAEQMENEIEFLLSNEQMELLAEIEK